MTICAGSSFPTPALFEIKARADATGAIATDAANGCATTTTRLLLRLTSTMLASSDVLSVVVVAGARNAAKLAVHLGGLWVDAKQVAFTSLIGGAIVLDVPVSCNVTPHLV